MKRENDTMYVIRWDKKIKSLMDTIIVHYGYALGVRCSNYYWLNNQREYFALLPGSKKSVRIECMF